MQVRRQGNSVIHLFSFQDKVVKLYIEPLLEQSLDFLCDTGFFFDDSALRFQVVLNNAIPTCSWLATSLVGGLYYHFQFSSIC